MGPDRSLTQPQLPASPITSSNDSSISPISAISHIARDSGLLFASSFPCSFFLDASYIISLGCPLPSLALNLPYLSTHPSPGPKWRSMPDIFPTTAWDPLKGARVSINCQLTTHREYCTLHTFIYHVAISRPGARSLTAVYPTLTWIRIRPGVATLHVSIFTRKIRALHN